MRAILHCRYSSHDTNAIHAVETCRTNRHGLRPPARLDSVRGQIKNFIRFCETAVKRGPVEKIKLVTGYDDEEQRLEVEDALASLRDSLIERGVELEVRFSDTIHDREIRTDHGWVIKIGRGLDFYQKPESWHALGVYDLDLRPCRETKVDIFRVENSEHSNNS